MGVNKQNNRRDKLNSQVEHSYKHKDDGGGFGIFKLSQGITLAKLEKDVRYRMIIFAFDVGENHPLVIKGKLEKGDPAYLVELHVHHKVGSVEKDIICLKETFGKKCFVCEERSRTGSDDLKPKKKVIYLVSFYDREKKGISNELKLLYQPHFCSERHIVGAARAQVDDDDGNYVSFPYMDGDGKYVRFMYVEDSFKNRKFTRMDGVSFSNIKNDIPKEILNNIIDPSDCLVVLNNDQIESIMVDSDDDEKEEENTKAEKSSSKKGKNKSKNECPFDHKFGIDFDTFEDDCDDCNKWDECKKASKDDEEDDD